jgi:hypothetical protein
VVVALCLYAAQVRGGRHERDVACFIGRARSIVMGKYNSSRNYKSHYLIGAQGA